MDVTALLDWATKELHSSDDDDTSDFAAEWEIQQLLSEVLEIPPAMLVAFPKQQVEGRMERKFRAAVGRRRAGEPLAYILGEWGFYGLDIKVNSSVLIPRPETEILVEQALTLFEEKPASFAIVDIGTGTGAIPIALLASLRDKFGADYLNQGSCVAVDVSNEALAVAKENIDRYELSSVIALQYSDVLEDVDALPSAELVLVVSNPPYIGDSEDLPRSVARFEPAVALRAGAEGLDIITRIGSQVYAQAQPGTVLLMEIGHTQRPAVESRFAEIGWGELTFYRDLHGIDRIVKATRS